MTAQPALLDVRPASRCGSTCRPPATTHAHCAAAGCHRTFASVTDFDRHRSEGHCLHPASLGLVERAGLWASPERHAKDATHAAHLARLRSGVPQPAPDATESLAGTSDHPRTPETESEPLEAPHV